MKRITKWGVSGIVMALGLGFAGITLLYSQTPTDTVKGFGAGCYLSGCNGCGGYNNDTKTNCSTKQRYCSWKCEGEPRAHNGCLADKGC